MILLINTGALDSNFLYLTGFTSGLFEGSLLIVERTGVTLLTSALEYDTALEQAVKGMKIIKLQSQEQLKKEFSRLKGKIVGINGAFVPYNVYERMKLLAIPKKFVDVSSAFYEARFIKDDDEQQRIAKAAKITKTAMQKIEKYFKLGMSEKDLAAKFDMLSTELGSDGPSFKTIVCFGKSAAFPHHMPDNTKLRHGDFVLIDAGSRVDNYCSDITRTFIFGDKKRINDYEKKMQMYNTVKEAQKLAMLTLKSGIKGSKPHLVAQDYIEKAFGGRYKGKFIHSLGHSLGLEVHDGSSTSRALSSKSDELLKPGMVFTVEPGIYVTGFGGVRIEDDIIITEEGYRVL